MILMKLAMNCKLSFIIPLFICSCSNIDNIIEGIETKEKVSFVKINFSSLPQFINDNVCFQDSTEKVKIVIDNNDSIVGLSKIITLADLTYGWHKIDFYSLEGLLGGYYLNRLEFGPNVLVPIRIVELGRYFNKGNYSAPYSA